MRQEKPFSKANNEETNDAENETSSEDSLASGRHDLYRVETDERTEVIRCRRCGLHSTPASISAFEICPETNESPTTSLDSHSSGAIRTDGGMAIEGTGKNTTLSDFVEDAPSPQYSCTNCEQAFETGPALGGHLSYCRDDSDRPWTDPDLLEEFYYGEEDLRLHEIADRFGVDYRTIWNAFDEFGIERDEATQNYPGVPFETYRVRENRLRGYERWVHTAEDGSRQTVRIHRLAAVAWHDFEAVAGNDIHHDLPFQWLNCEFNLIPLDHGEHTSYEAKRRNGEETDSVPTPGYDWAEVEP